MSRPAKLALPMRDGVSPSVVACPAGAWPSTLAFLAERLPQVSRADWQARLQRGDVMDERGRALRPDAPFRADTRLYYFRQLDAEPAVVPDGPLGE